jgi:hypothetical protein
LTPDRAPELRRLELQPNLDEALRLYDSLPPVALEFMLGNWRGRGLPTGHPLDGLLESARWRGKRFRSHDDVDPLVFLGGGGLVALNPALMPLVFGQKHPALLKHPVTVALFRLLQPLLRTRQPKARLRMTEYRGVLSATMIYDDLPICDVFRKVSERVVVGAMDLRGSPQPSLFSLERES